MEPVSTPVVTYWAISILSSRTFWFNAAAFLIAVLSAAEVVTIVPARYAPVYSAVVAVLNIALRVTTVRPVAFIAPGNTLPITVEKIMTPPKTTVAD